MISYTSVLFVLLACINIVNAEVYYVGPTVGGIISLIIIILDIIAIIEVLRSGKPMVEKLLWILLILIFPIVGLIIYLLCGRSRAIDI